MRLNRARLFVVLALLLEGTLGCGARTDLDAFHRSSSGAGGASSSSASTASSSASTTDASSSMSAGGAAPIVCTELGPPLSPPLAITDPTGDAMLTALLIDGNRAFVASTNDNDPSPDPTWRVREMSTDLSSVGPSQIVATRGQHVSYSGMSLAAKNGHRGALYWDENTGSHFVNILDDGSAGASTSIDPAWCYSLGATDQGYLAQSSAGFGFKPLTLFDLDVNGAVTSKVEVLGPTMDSNYPEGRVALADGTYLLAWHELQPNTRKATHITADGKVLSDDQVIVELGDNPRFAISSANGRAIAVWSSDHAPGDVFTAELDDTGKPLSTHTVAHATAPVESVAIRTQGDGALVAWSESTGPSIIVSRVTEGGVPVGQSVTIPTPATAYDIRLGPSPSGAVVAFSAIAPGSLTQVFVSAMTCLVE